MRRVNTFGIFAAVFIAIFYHFSFTQVLEKDSLALVALYDSLEGANWKSPWDLSDSVSNWYGITVEGNRVTKIDLRYCNLKGHLPPQIGDLDSLKIIFMLGNQIEGSIPPEIGNLVNLEELYLSNNKIQGGIPASLGNCQKLKTLRLENNQISGELPPELGNLTNLEDLYVSKNLITGPIPPSYGNLTKLRILGLSMNQLTGAIPPELGNLSKLTHFYLDFNHLTGNVPATLGNLTNVVFFELSQNQLSDTLPASLGNLTSLKYFRIQNNQFSGAIPATFTQLTQLIEFNISYNEFESLPDLSGISTLEKLYVQNNRFTFEDLEPLLNCENLSQFMYFDQDSVGLKQTITVNEGDSVAFTIHVGGQWTKYQWYKNDVVIAGATDSILILPSVVPEDSGRYICETTNDSLPYLVIYSRPIKLEVGTGISDLGDTDEATLLPTQTELFPNYPNPFNPETQISYHLAKAGKVELRIFNVNGQLVRTLVEGFQQAGKHQIVFSAADLPSGVYFYQLKAGRFQQTRKMILMR